MMAPRRFVVLDRDGTVILERNYLSDPEQVELLPGAAGALRQLRRMGLGLVLMTNQSAIGRGFFTEQRLGDIHQRLTQLLAAEGVRLDGIYYCPHTPEEGCHCRKPQPGLVEQAARELGFDPRASVVIGDKPCDLELGRQVGATTVLVHTGYGAQMAPRCQGIADYVVDDLAAAVPVIRRWHRPARLTPAATDVVVLCGGRGTRLGALSLKTPKPLLPIGGKPFLLHRLLRLKAEGFTRIILVAHHLADQFEAFVRDAVEGGISGLELIVEPAPLGTGGALRYAAERVRSSTFVALNGDSWFPQPLAAVLREHEGARRRFTAVVVPASQVQGGAFNKGTWEVGLDGAVKGFATSQLASAGWVNAGMYVIDRALACAWPSAPYSLEDNFTRLLAGKTSGVFCSKVPLLDIGTPQCYVLAEQLLGASEHMIALEHVQDAAPRS